MEKPDVDQIDGLSPAISIDQKGASRNPRSTVGTVTEIYDYLRLLFARVGHPHCPNGHPIERQSVQQIVDQVLALPEGTRLLVLGPLIKDRKTEGDRVFEGARRAGLRPRPGRRRDVRPGRGADARQVQAPQHRGRRRPLHRPPRRGARGRGADAGRPPDRPGDRPGRCRTRTPSGSPTRSRPRSASARASSSSRRRRATARRPPFEERRYSERFTCPYDGFTIDELEPRNFSFNSPHGACPACTGLGTRLEIDPDLVIPDRTKSLQQGALVPWAKMPNDASWRLKILEAICQSHGWRLQRSRSRTCRARRSSTSSAPRRTRRSSSATATSAARTRYKATFEGSSRTSSGATARPTRSTSRPSSRSTWSPGPARPATGKRLKPEVLAVTVDDRNISDGRDAVDHRRARLGGDAGRRSSPSASGRSPARSSRRSPPGSASSSTSGSTT